MVADDVHDDGALQVRQGDLLVERVHVLPTGLVAVEAGSHGGRRAHVLARGERTGHAHWPPAEPTVCFFRAVAGPVGLMLGYADIPSPTNLRHDEHRPVRLGPGLWRIRRRRQYVPGAATADAVD